jgi:GDP-L-fucose synthase
MVRKFHEACQKNLNQVFLWGTGSPMREFLHVDDLAEAVLFMLESTPKESLYNVGSGKDLTIKDLALKIKSATSYTGEIYWDDSKPDGTPRKLMDSTKLKKLGWQPNISLDNGIIQTYNWFINNHKI